MKPSKTFVTVLLIVSLVITSCYENQENVAPSIFKFSSGEEVLRSLGATLNLVSSDYTIMSNPDGSTQDVEFLNFIITDGKYIEGKGKSFMSSYEGATYMLHLSIFTPQSHGFITGEYTSPTLTNGMGFSTYLYYASSYTTAVQHTSPAILTVDKVKNYVEMSFEGSLLYYQYDTNGVFEGMVDKATHFTYEGPVTDLRTR